MSPAQKDMSTYQPPAVGVFVYGASGAGKTRSVANLIKNDPQGGVYVFNEDPGLMTLKDAGVEEIQFEHSLDPKVFLEVVKSAVGKEYRWIVLDSVSTWYERLLRKHLEAEGVKLGKVPREAYMYTMEWVETLMYRCMDLVNVGTHVVCLCHEKTTQNDDRVFFTPALTGQLPERVLRKFHVVVRCVRYSAGGQRRHYFTIPDSPSAGKDLLGLVGDRIDNDVALLLPNSEGVENQQHYTHPTPSPPNLDLPISARQAHFLRHLCSEAQQPSTYLDDYLNKELNTTLNALTENQIAQVTTHLTELKDKQPQDPIPF